MLRIFIFLFFLTVLTVQTYSVNDIKPGTILHVLAPSGLVLRDKPNGKPITVVPYGSEVTVLKDTEKLQSHELDGYTGLWQKVMYNNTTGYLFDGLTSRFQAPNIKEPSTLNPSFIDIYFPKTKWFTYIMESSTVYKQKIEIEDVFKVNTYSFTTNRSYYFRNGIIYSYDMVRVDSTGYFSLYFIEIPDISFQELFLLHNLINPVDDLANRSNKINYMPFKDSNETGSQKFRFVRLYKDPQIEVMEIGDFYDLGTYFERKVNSRTVTISPVIP